MILDEATEVVINGMVFDLENLRETAEVVRVLNPHAEHFTTNELVEQMIRTAREARLDTDLGYVGYRGFMLTAFRCSSDERVHIKASVSSYCVASYLKEKKVSQ